MVSTQLLMVVLGLGIGTYLFRAIPLFLSQLQRNKRKKTDTPGQVSLLEVIAPMLIAALLSVSIVPEQSKANIHDLILVILSMMVTWLANRMLKNFGLSILIGVFGYGVLQVIWRFLAS